MLRKFLIGLGLIFASAIGVVVVAVALFGAGKGGDTTAAGNQPGRPVEVGVTEGEAEDQPPAEPVPSLMDKPRKGPFFPIVRLYPGARVPMRAAPGGELIDILGSQSEFGSPTVLGVAEQRGPWLGATTPLRPNNTPGWIRLDREDLDLYWTRYSLTVRLPERTLELRYGRRLLNTYPVTVGASGSTTPIGRFSITDALEFDASPYYGCCALALSGRQESLPPGWLGGDRIAIHGTLGPVGDAASQGCIRATDATMRTLFARIPLGTPVFVSG
ncbi:MAG: L,D-transpeptidase [Actinomycetota bacterium]